MSKPTYTRHRTQPGVDPNLPVNLTFDHMVRDLKHAEKTYRIFASSNESYWAADWDRYSRQIAGKMKEYRQFLRAGDTSGMRMCLRQYEHDPFKRPQNLSQIVRNGKVVQMQMNYYK